MALYNQLYIYLNGALLVENATVETSLERSDANIFDLRTGWAGISAGPAFRRISSSNFIPLTGAQFDFEKLYLDKIRVVIRLVEAAGGKTLNSTGFITAVTRSASVGNNYTVNFEFRGTAESFA